MDIGKIEKAVESISLPVINNLGYELVDVEFINEEDEWYLRLYIDKAEGITIDDCTKVSRSIDELIDEADPVEIGYYLEVSSPGPNRKLKLEKDYIKFKGENIKIFLQDAFDGKYEVEGRSLRLLCHIEHLFCSYYNRTYVLLSRFFRTFV
jgi:ribosome maturation factor RimP